MQKAKGFLNEIRSMHSSVDKETIEKMVEMKKQANMNEEKANVEENANMNDEEDLGRRPFRHSLLSHLMALLAIRTKEDNKVKNAVHLSDVIEMYMKMHMKDEKGKKSGIAEGQKKKDKKRLSL